MCVVPVGLKSSAEPRNDQVRANRGNENSNKQPVHFEAPPKLSIPQTQADELLQNFVFCNRGKRRLRSSSTSRFALCYLARVKTFSVASISCGSAMSGRNTPPPQ